jgi:hypothetical protein
MEGSPAHQLLMRAVDTTGKGDDGGAPPPLLQHPPSRPTLASLARTLLQLPKKQHARRLEQLAAAVAHQRVALRATAGVQARAAGRCWPHAGRRAGWRPARELLLWGLWRSALAAGAGVPGDRCCSIHGSRHPKGAPVRGCGVTAARGSEDQIGLHAVCIQFATSCVLSVCRHVWVELVSSMNPVVHWCVPSCCAGWAWMACTLASHVEQTPPRRYLHLQPAQRWRVNPRSPWFRRLQDGRPHTAARRRFRAGLAAWPAAARHAPPAHLQTPAAKRRFRHEGCGLRALRRLKAGAACVSCTAATWEYLRGRELRDGWRRTGQRSALQRSSGCRGLCILGQ